MRNCPFHGCQATVPDHIFACRGHWHSLNAAQKAEIHAAYAAYQHDLIDLEDLRGRQQAVLDATRAGGVAS